MRIRGLLALLLLAVVLLHAQASTINIRDFDAVGDGKADDTAAFRKAFKQLKAGKSPKLVVPAGRYRITQTLKMDLVGRSIIEGEGRNTVLFWDGEPGGTLWETYGGLFNEYRDLTLSGLPPGSKDAEKQAGILYQARSIRGGNMNNRFVNVLFAAAEVGVQMGGDNRQEMCNADYAFTHVHASRLGTFLLVRNDQGVDFLVNKLFAVSCGTVFNFERGGNLTVNNAQMTKCRLFLNIEGGGRNAATFVLNNVRHEEPVSYKAGRDQILKATNIKWEQALVRFTGFNDVQWSWFRRPSEARWRPLCEIGPGVNVTFENSAFNGPVAEVNGKEGKPGSIVLRECTYGFILPHQALRAGKHGYIRSTNCFSDHMEPLPDIRKWPRQPVMNVAANDTFGGHELPPVIRGADDAIEALKKERTKWIETLDKTPEEDSAR